MSNAVEHHSRCIMIHFCWEPERCSLGIISLDVGPVIFFPWLDLMSVLSLVLVLAASKIFEGAS